MKRCAGCNKAKEHTLLQVSEMHAFLTSCSRIVLLYEESERILNAITIQTMIAVRGSHHSAHHSLGCTRFEASCNMVWQVSEHYKAYEKTALPLPCFVRPQSGLHRFSRSPHVGCQSRRDGWIALHGKLLRRLYLLGFSSDDDRLWRRAERVGKSGGDANRLRFLRPAERTRCLYDERSGRYVNRHKRVESAAERFIDGDVERERGEFQRVWRLCGHTHLRAPRLRRRATRAASFRRGRDLLNLFAGWR